MSEPVWRPLQEGWAPCWFESFEDGDLTPLGGQPITSPDIYGFASFLQVPVQGEVSVGWAYEGGPGYLDLTDPQNPVMLTSGVYVFTGQLMVSAWDDPVTVLQYAFASLGADSPGIYQASPTVTIGPTNSNSSLIAVTYASYIPAGAVVNLSCAESTNDPDAVPLGVDLSSMLVQAVALGVAS